MPSFRAIVASSTSWLINSNGFSIFRENALPNTPIAPKNSPSVQRASTTAIDPATTIKSDAVSTKAAAFAAIAI